MACRAVSVSARLDPQDIGKSARTNCSQNERSYPHKATRTNFAQGNIARRAQPLTDTVLNVKLGKRGS
jgi:hypothetical protein